MEVQPARLQMTSCVMYTQKKSWLIHPYCLTSLWEHYEGTLVSTKTFVYQKLIGCLNERIFIFWLTFKSTFNLIEEFDGSLWPVHSYDGLRIWGKLKYCVDTSQHHSTMDGQPKCSPYDMAHMNHQVKYFLTGHFTVLFLYILKHFKHIYALFTDV